jgi:hypothetical protein
MEGLAPAASVIAAAGLAGQVAQGCNYLQSVFSSVKSAPEDLHLISTELTIIEQIVLSIQDECELRYALDLCNVTIEKLLPSCPIIGLELNGLSVIGCHVSYNADELSSALHRCKIPH